ncbi:MAG: PadR family transcriptional regulator, partial [Candidatus Bathyarchaeia archaeon]
MKPSKSNPPIKFPNGSWSSRHKEWPNLKKDESGTHEKLVKSMLDLVVLGALAQSPAMGAYGIVSWILDKLNVLISPSRIYPVLKALEEEGLVARERTTKRKTYRLTEKGEARVETLTKSYGRVLDIITSETPGP